MVYPSRRRTTLRSVGCGLDTAQHIACRLSRLVGDYLCVLEAPISALFGSREPVCVHTSYGQPSVICFAHNKRSSGSTFSTLMFCPSHPIAPFPFLSCLPKHVSGDLAAGSPCKEWLALIGRSGYGLSARFRQVLCFDHVCSNGTRQSVA